MNWKVFWETLQAWCWIYMGLVWFSLLVAAAIEGSLLILTAVLFTPVVVFAMREARK